MKNKTNLILGIILTILGVGITIGTFFFFGPFFGCPILLIGNVLLFDSIFSGLNKIIKLIISILVSLIICLIVIIISVKFWKPNYVSKDDTLNYLKNNYLLNDLVLVNEDSLDDIYIYYFTNQELNGKVFFVETNFDSNGNKVFKDNYISTKYDENLKNEYSVYFDKIVKQNFEISIIVEDVYNIPLISYDEYIKLIYDKKIGINLSPKLKLDQNNKHFHLKTTDDSIGIDELNAADSEISEFINDNFNIQNLKNDVKEIIELNNLNNVSKVNFNFNDCGKNEFVISCSEIIELYNN